MGLDEVFESAAGVGGFTLAALAGAALLIGKGGRPLAKKAMKGSLVLGERVRELAAEASEQVQDLYAEVKAEMEATASPADSAAESAPAA